MSIAVEAAPVSFTEGAVKELKKLKDQQELNDDFGLRVGVEAKYIAHTRAATAFNTYTQAEIIIQFLLVF